MFLLFTIVQAMLKRRFQHGQLKPSQIRKVVTQQADDVSFTAPHSDRFGRRADGHVIASEAKQSRGHEQRLDCFVARAPRNDADTDSLTRS
jgi:hypothetical protein